MQKGLPLRSFLAEGGQVQVLIMAGIVILIAVAGGIFYLSRVSAPKPQIQTPVETSSPQPSPLSTETSMKVEDPTANWKNFTYTIASISFKYPNSWYVQDDSEYGGAPEGTSFGFYIGGAKADPTYGDHTGNEILNVSFSEGEFSLEELKKNNKKAIETTINGKPALRTDSFIQIITNKGLFHLGFKGEGKTNLDQILSTFRFLD